MSAISNSKGGLSVALPSDDSVVFGYADGQQKKVISNGVRGKELWLSIPTKEAPWLHKPLIISLNQAVEAFPGVFITFTDANKRRINIKAPKDVNIRHFKAESLHLS